jgi:hypothetical protein
MSWFRQNSKRDRIVGIRDGDSFNYFANKRNKYQQVKLK